MRHVSRKDAFFGFHTDLHAHERDTCLGADVDEDMVNRFLRVVEPDYVQYDCKGHHGYASYPTEVGWAAPGIEKDALEIWRRATKRHGVALVVHYSGVWDRTAIEHHPEWAAVNADGSPDQFATSTFSPYVDELLIPQLKEVISNYDVDAVWVDGDCWGARLDYSEKALEEFRKETGIENAPRSRDDPHWHEFVEVNREQFRRYVRKYVDALHEFKPGFQLTSNWMFTPLMPEPVSVPLDFLSGDCLPQEVVNLGRLTARYMPAVGIPWDLMAWGFNKGEDQSSWSLKSPSQLKQEAASVLAQGGGWQVVCQGTRSGHLDDCTVDLVADVAKFCRQRQALCHRSLPVPEVALLLPATSIYDKLPAIFGFPDTMRPHVLGLLHALLELHYSVDVKAEHQLSGHLQDYPAVAIPDCHILPEGFIGELKEYVCEGGSLLLGGPQVASPFKNEIGVSYDGEMIDMNRLYRELEERAENKGLMFLDPDFPELYIEAEGMLADCAGLHQKVKPTTAEPISCCYPSKDTRKGEMCASSVVKFGRGMFGAVYVSLGASFYESHAPVLRKAFKKIMNRLFPSPTVELDAPNCIDVAVRKKNGKLLIHLVNTSGMHTSAKYAITDYIPPVTDVRMAVRLDAEPKSAEWAYGGTSAEMHYKNGKLQVVLDRLEIHDVLVIDRAGSEVA